MIVTTTNDLEGWRVVGYLGIVSGEVILGVNFIKDFGAAIRNVIGGRSSGYEEELQDARERSLEEMQQRARALGADAVLAVRVDYEVLGPNGGMLMAACSGTAVRLARVA